MDLLANRAVQVGLLAIILLVSAGVLMTYLSRRGRRAGRKVRVVGVGGGGSNAVDALIRKRTPGVEYVVINTDVQALNRSLAVRRLQIGKAITDGLGSGGDPAVGEAAAREAAVEIGRALKGADLVVVTAGLGGGTGSGAAPVVASIAREQGALTLAVATKPFGFEGPRRHAVAEAAGVELRKQVDAVVTVLNDRVRDIVAAEASVQDAFRTVDDILCSGVREILDIISVQGRINLDFADVRSVMKSGGAMVMGVGRASGENRAVEAARRAMAATLVEGKMHGATSILLNVSGSANLTLAELTAAAEEIRAAADPNANLIFGTSIDRRLRKEVQVTLIATGFDRGSRGRSARIPTTSLPDLPETVIRVGGSGERSWVPPWRRDRSQPVAPVPTDEEPLPVESGAQSVETTDEPAAVGAGEPDMGNRESRRARRRNRRATNGSEVPGASATAVAGTIDAIGENDLDVPTFLRKK